MHSHSDCHSAWTVDRSGEDQMPSELVGVAGFEPAASSSRSQRAMRPTITFAPSDLPRSVRGRPLASAGIRGGCYSLSYSPPRDTVTVAAALAPTPRLLGVSALPG